MASYVIINIQTANPNIEIYAPSYTTNEQVNEITIQSNVQLSLNGALFYTIDSSGNRTDYTFQLEGDNYIGYVKFANVPVGSIITLYAQVQDDVGNTSNLISKAIFVVNQVPKLSLDIDDKPTVNVSVNDKEHKINIDDSEPMINVNVNDKEHKININDESRNVKIADLDRSESIGNN